MVQDTRFWDDVNRLFHRRSNLYYVLGEAFPTTKAEAATHGWRVNTGDEVGGPVRGQYKAVFLSGATGDPGSGTAPGIANLQSVGANITPGTKPEVIFAGIPVTVGGVSAIEEIRVQYTVQSGDDHSDITDALATGITDLLDDPSGLDTNILVRCTNIEANLTQISTGMRTKYNITADVALLEIAAAVATTDVLVITSKTDGPGTDANLFEVGGAVLDKPPSPLLLNPNGVPRLAGIRHRGFTRAFKGSFSATEAEILSDQQIPKVKTFLSAQASQATFEMLQDEDPTQIESVSGTASITNDATRDYILPVSKGVQQTYSLILVVDNALGFGYDYLWLYRGRSAQFDIAREIRTHSPIAVTFSADLFLGRADSVGHYGISLSL